MVVVCDKVLEEVTGRLARARHVDAYDLDQHSDDAG